MIPMMLSQVLAPDGRDALIEHSLLHDVFAKRGGDVCCQLLGTFWNNKHAKQYRYFATK